jgi:hypothetical protein
MAAQPLFTTDNDFSTATLKLKGRRKTRNENLNTENEIPSVPAPASRIERTRDSYRVNYSLYGSGRRITVLAESSAEARRTVMDLYPKAVVTGVRRVSRRFSVFLSGTDREGPTKFCESICESFTT